ncbi:hypothetical protein ACFX1Q_009495 [Malus domestica]
MSKGWREVKHSADADLLSMKHRPNEFKNLATSFDCELENLFKFNFLPSSAGIQSLALQSTEIAFVNKLQSQVESFFLYFVKMGFTAFTVF